MEWNFRLQQLLKQVNYFLLGNLLGKMISYLFVLRFLICVKKLFLVVNKIMHLGDLSTVPGSLWNQNNVSHCYFCLSQIDNYLPQHLINSWFLLDRYGVLTVTYINAFLYADLFLDPLMFFVYVYLDLVPILCLCSWYSFKVI